MLGARTNGIALALLAALAASACGGGDPASGVGPEPVPSSDANAPEPEPDAAIAAPPPECVAPAGVSTAPRTVAEAVALINALPKPLSLACFLESLTRPLALQAVDSLLSAQPAQGKRSPRLFVFFEGLTLSIVPEGPGAHLLEFGELRGEAQSLKAELEFPITGPLDEAAAYERVYFDDDISTCGFCHQGEERALDVASPLAFVSPALAPRWDQRVPLADLVLEHASCDAEQEPERCAMLAALFGRSPVPVEHDFPEDFATFF